MPTIHHIRAPGIFWLVSWWLLDSISSSIMVSTYYCTCRLHFCLAVSLCIFLCTAVMVATAVVAVENKMQKTTLKSIGYGIGAALILLAVYFLVLTLVSGRSFTQSQFATYWYFIISLAVGFGIQIALYQYIKNLVHGEQGMGKVVGVSGTTSTAAMISCCAHYLVNLVPVLGVTGFVTFAAQYQVELFWVGLLFNLGGIFYIANKIITFKQAWNIYCT